MSTGERRVCLLTGASGTLGDAFCRAYYQDYDIVAVCRTRTPDTPSQLKWYVDPLAPKTPVPDNESRVFVVRADLTQPGEVERVVDLALARFGQVDLLVNNAAQVRLHPRGIVDGDAALEQFDPHFALNVSVPLRFRRASRNDPGYTQATRTARATAISSTSPASPAPRCTPDRRCTRRRRPRSIT